MGIKENIKLFKKNIRAQIRKKMLGPFAVGILCKTEKGLFVVGAEDFVVGKKMAKTGSWDSTNLAVLESLIHEKSNVCFVGTHIGTLLVPIARQVGYVSGYEANSDTYELLKVNLQINQLQNCDVYNLAAGDKAGTVTFSKNRVNSGGSKVFTGATQYMYRYDNPEMVEVDMVSLDAHNAKGVAYDVIVMDIEGFEYFALKGMQEMLDSCVHLQVEYVPHHLDNITRVTDKEFLSAFSDKFNIARIVGDTDRHYKKEQFLELLTHLRQNNICADLIFSK